MPGLKARYMVAKILEKNGSMHLVPSSANPHSRSDVIGDDVKILRALINATPFEGRLNVTFLGCRDNHLVFEKNYK